MTVGQLRERLRDVPDDAVVELHVDTEQGRDYDASIEKTWVTTQAESPTKLFHIEILL